MPRITRPDMKDYGVPEDLDGALDWAWAEQRLSDCRNFWLVTVSGSGRPHSMPVWGVWMPERERFGFSCAPTARKARNIAANDQVVVTNDDTINCVSIEGRAAQLTGDALEATAQAWAAKYVDDGLKEDDLVGFFQQNAAYEVTPDRAFGIVETPDEFAASATKWVWD